VKYNPKPPYAYYLALLEEKLLAERAKNFI
jgi:hypothetical protein